MQSCALLNVLHTIRLSPLIWVTRRSIYSGLSTKLMCLFWYFIDNTYETQISYATRAIYWISSNKRTSTVTCDPARREAGAGEGAGARVDKGRTRCSRNWSTANWPLGPSVWTTNWPRVTGRDLTMHAETSLSRECICTPLLSAEASAADATCVIPLMPSYQYCIYHSTVVERLSEV